MIYGGQLKVSSEAGLTGWARSCTITRQADVKEIAPQTASTAKEYVAGRTSWTVEVSGLMSAMSNRPAVGTVYTLSITDGNTTETGSAICTSVKQTGTIFNLAQQAVTFQGTGPLT